MAQRAFLARELPDRSVEYIYLHYGSFEDAGAPLLQNCATPEQVATLLAAGDRSTVSEIPGNPPAAETTPAAEPYAAGPRRAASLAALIQQLNARPRPKAPALTAGRIYCYQPETGWLHYFRKAAAPRPLAEILTAA